MLNSLYTSLDLSKYYTTVVGNDGDIWPTSTCCAVNIGMTSMVSLSLLGKLFQDSQGTREVAGGDAA